MRLPWHRDDETPEGVKAVDRILAGVEAVKQAVADLERTVESMRRER